MGDLAEVMNLFGSFFSQVLTLVPFVSLYYTLAPWWSLPCRSSFDRMSKSGRHFSIVMESLKFAATPKCMGEDGGWKRFCHTGAEAQSKHIKKFKGKSTRLHETSPGKSFEAERQSLRGLPKRMLNNRSL